MLSVSHFTTVEADLAGAGGIELGLKEQAESRSSAQFQSRAHKTQ